MQGTGQDIPGRITNIFHPSDFSGASERAFAHALRIALIANANLNIMHVASDGLAEWSDMAAVRPMLERWGLLPPGSPRSAVADLGVGVKKVMSLHKDPVRAVLAYLDSHRTDLIVLATRQHEGRVRWFHDSVARPIAEGAGQMTLFLPQGREGFVSVEDGSMSLANILIPIAHEPAAQPAIEAVRRMTGMLNLDAGTVTLLYVGRSEDIPAVELPHDTGWTWTTITGDGDVVDNIVQSAEKTAAGLVVMTTDGRQGFLDALRGSHCERVLNRIPCPLLNLPVGSFLG